MNETKAEFKDRLRQAMAIRGVKAAELCERTGIPKSAVSYYMSGKSKPKDARTYLIAVALDVSEAWLMGFDVQMERSGLQRKNDELVKLVDRMKNDNDFYSLVAALNTLPAKQLDLVKHLMSTLVEK